MESEKMEKSEHLLRDLARSILGTLEKAHESVQNLGGVQPAEMRKDTDINGTIDELNMILLDVECAATNLLSLIDQVNQRV